MCNRTIGISSSSSSFVFCFWLVSSRFKIISTINGRWQVIVKHVGHGHLLVCRNWLISRLKVTEEAPCCFFLEISSESNTAAHVVNTSSDSFCTP
jgi:hypothetical protein